MPSIFTKIIQGEIPAHFIYKDEKCVAFMDLNPINPGHVLLVPRIEVDLLWQLPADVYQHLWSVAQKLEPAIKKASGCIRVGVAVLGFDVPHTHIHLVPVNGGKELDFHKAKRAFDADLLSMKEKILAAL